MKARSKAFLILILSLSFCLFSFFSFSSFSSSPLLSTTNIHAHALPPPPLDALPVSVARVAVEVGLLQRGVCAEGALVGALAGVAADVAHEATL